MNGYMNTDILSKDICNTTGKVQERQQKPEMRYTSAVSGYVSDGVGQYSLNPKI